MKYYAALTAKNHAELAAAAADCTDLLLVFPLYADDDHAGHEGVHQRGDDQDARSLSLSSFSSVSSTILNLGARSLACFFICALIPSAF